MCDGGSVSLRDSRICTTVKVFFSPCLAGTLRTWQTLRFCRRMWQQVLAGMVELGMVGKACPRLLPLGQVRVWRAGAWGCIAFQKLLLAGEPPPSAFFEIPHVLLRGFGRLSLVLLSTIEFMRFHRHLFKTRPSLCVCTPSWYTVDVLPRTFNQITEASPLTVTVRIVFDRNLLGHPRRLALRPP